MKTLCWFSACAVALAVYSVGAAEQDKGEKFDPAKMVGEWKFVTGVKDGAKMDPKTFEKQSCTISKEAFTLKSGDATFVMKYELDTKTTPVGIQIEIKEGPVGEGSKAKGIIQVKGDEMTLCYEPAGGDAPKTFESKEGSKFHLFTLKKTK